MGCAGTFPRFRRPPIEDARQPFYSAGETGCGFLEVRPTSGDKHRAARFRAPFAVMARASAVADATAIERTVTVNAVTVDATSRVCCEFGRYFYETASCARPHRHAWETRKSAQAPPHDLGEWRLFREMTPPSSRGADRPGPFEPHAPGTRKSAYTQRTLEQLAEVNDCDVTDLLSRDPTRPDVAAEAPSLRDAPVSPDPSMAHGGGSLSPADLKSRQEEIRAVNRVVFENVEGWVGDRVLAHPRFHPAPSLRS